MLKSKQISGERKVNGEFLPETINYMKNADPEYRKKWGQFFTPKSIREELISKLPRLTAPKVLDPACGTGEFLLTAKGYFTNPELHGWEIDPELVRLAGHVVPDAYIELVDALEKPLKEEFDVVLGNPPYFEFKPRKEIRQKFAEVIWGRPNIYAFFIYLGLRVLKRGGYLAYVVSSSMNNGAYFKKLRDFIRKNSEIVYMRVLEDAHIFEGANHTFQLLVLQKGSPSTGKYIFSHGGLSIFSEKSEELKEIFSFAKTLHQLGYRVQTGKIVWNQNKNRLTNNPENGIPLIWAHNIVAGELVFNNKDKPQYIKSMVYDRGPAIVVRRIVGHPTSGSIEAALIPSGFKFLAENHVNVIYPPPNASEEELREIVRQLNSRESQSAVRMITGNTQISKSELERLFPIKI